MTAGKPQHTTPSGVGRRRGRTGTHRRAATAESRAQPPTAQAAATAAAKLTPELTEGPYWSTP